MKIGYARVSTAHQNLDAQISALEHAGCERIFQEKQSSRKQREVLQEALSFIREGDTLVVTKLDRLGRSLKELIDILETLNKRGITIYAIDDGINTSSTIGKTMFQLFALFAEMELTFNKERRERAIYAGRKGGRPRVRTDKIIKHVCTLYEAKDENGEYKYSISEIENLTKLSKPTIYECLKENNISLRNN